jgi:hypothetical protein|eukprot:COSAG06_NODE_661_length_13303_cov_26.208725_13_plen_355_part_00
MERLEVSLARNLLACENRSRPSITFVPTVESKEEKVQTNAVAVLTMVLLPLPLLLLPLLLLTAAAGERLSHRLSYPPAPLGGWAARASVLPSSIGGNPFAALPRLPKPHQSWPICGIARSMAGCIKRSDQVLVDFARVTGVLPLGLDGVNVGTQWDTSFDDSTLPEAVAICAAANCTLGLSYSPWDQYYPSPSDPTFEGATPMPFSAGGKPRIGSEAAEVAFWRSRLLAVKAGLAAANAAHGLTGSLAVVVSAVFVDSEKFGSDCPHVMCNATQQAAIQRKHDLIYNQSAEVFPHAAFDAFDRGGVEHFTEGDQVRTSFLHTFCLPTCGQICFVCTQARLVSSLSADIRPRARV